jgi:hypothetical protein
MLSYDIYILRIVFIRGSDKGRKLLYLDLFTKDKPRKVWDDDLFLSSLSLATKTPTIIELFNRWVKHIKKDKGVFGKTKQIFTDMFNDEVD